MTDDYSRPAANADEFSISVEEAADRYARAAHPRTIRAIQKYCKRGDLECRKAETPYGERYLITLSSISRHIAQIEELRQTTVRDQSRTFANVRPAEVPNQSSAGDDAAVREQPRSDANVRLMVHGVEATNDSSTVRHRSQQDAVADKYVARLEGEVEFLRGQVTTKDAQIKELTERSHETNVLIGGLQRMLAPLLGSPAGKENEHFSQ